MNVCIHPNDLMQPGEVFMINKCEARLEDFGLTSSDSPFFSFVWTDCLYNGVALTQQFTMISYRNIANIKNIYKRQYNGKLMWVILSNDERDN